jgi:tetratricopeptide (TPR) repeat protein
MLKQLLLTVLLFSLGYEVFGQTPYNAEAAYNEGNFMRAKTEIDAWLAEGDNDKNEEGWYLKAKIYNSIADDVSLRMKVPGARMEAFRALEKYVEIAEGDLTALVADGYKPINDIYTGFYQEAANSFNEQEYETALEGFSNAVIVSRFMNDQSWITMALDTNSVLYAGVSAEKLGRMSEAVNYYGMLAEHKVTGEGFGEIYKWVANYYFEAKDLASAEKYLAIGKEVYPLDPFWASLEIDMARETGDKTALYNKYEEVIRGEPANSLYRYNYAVELYQEGYKTDLGSRPANSEDLIRKAQLQIKEAVRLNPDYVAAQLFTGQIAYNQAVDLLNDAKAITGTMPAETTKKQALKQEALKKFEEALPYFKTVEKLINEKGDNSPDEKSYLKEAYELMVVIYDQKDMEAEAKAYEQKVSELE